MKVTVIGSRFCGDTAESLKTLKKVNADVDYQDISDSLEALKLYLAMRDREPMYEAVKAAGSLGISCFVTEDGRKTFALSEVL